jgi:hypothetical protein
MFRLFAATMTLAVLTGAVGRAQAPSGLSGQWVLAEVPLGAADHQPADALTIREIVAQTTASGIATPPTLSGLAIERRTGADIHESTIQIGLNGGMSGGAPASSSGRPRVDTDSRWSTRWVDGHLVVWRIERTTTDGQVSEAEMSDDWSINAAGQLVIETSFRETGHAPTRTTAIYRRQ